MPTRWNPDFEHEEITGLGQPDSLFAQAECAYRGTGYNLAMFHPGSVALGPVDPLMNVGAVNHWTLSMSESFAAAAQQMQENIQLRFREVALERVVSDLERRIQRLETSQTFVVPIQTFEPEPYDITSDILVVVRPDEEEFGATHFDSNLNATGDNPVEAVENLKSIMLDAFDRYSELEKEGRLGLAPARQLAVLKQYIRVRAK